MGGDEETTYQVVMRKPKEVYKPENTDSYDSSDTNEDDSKKKKHVKWSESTEMRERLKVYRRSQMDIPLDYHHLAIEEEREKEGVHLWRNHLKNEDEIDDDEISKFGENGYMERNIQIIKEETTRFTLYPAYSAAVSAYEQWLSNAENTKQLTDDQKATMTSQLELYKRLVGIYKEWSQQTRTDFPRESRFGEITTILQEAADLGQPPLSVSIVIREVLTDEENIQKQVDAYNCQVQEMLAALDIKSKV
ncbi:unnamed protein product [Candidula unifasciata]|uniref:Peroxin-19 n=1 Tax=Candidula unifasciata TaxID=100452 RepID=A0A8S3ZY79_9EUPU|nr:unnamed protein product [Candidula unifasciata]